MFDNHEAVLGKLAATGKKEFSMDTIKAMMEEVWQEGAAQHERDISQTDKLYDYFSDPATVKLIDQLPPAPATEELEH